jgi:MerR family transcriptional regulator, copper efflux regulator
MPALKIGQVAALAGVRIDTVRYYERLGILPTAARTASGYRSFDASTVERIRLVKQLQDLGLTLEEIDAMLGAVIKNGSDCAQESQHIEAALRRTEEKLVTLTIVRETLRRTLRRCRRGDCDLVDRVKRVTTPQCP